MVIVDTSAWVQFLRYRGSPEHREVDALLERGVVAMVGPVIAELLQGARDERERDSLAQTLLALPYLDTTQAAWARAGALSFGLRRRGRKLPLSDLVLAAIAVEGGHAVYSLDVHFRVVPELKLHEPGVA